MSRKEIVEQKAWDLLQPITEELHLIPVDAEFVREGPDYYLRLYIDKEGGVGIDECEQVSKMIDPLLDEADFISEPYTLEVSSPGLGRILKRPHDFEYAEGREVEVHTYRAIDGEKEFRGVLKAWDKNSVTIADGDRERIFEKNEISVDHTLHYGMTLEGKTAFYMTQPKTKASRRVIPMLPEVSSTLAEMYKRRGDFNAEYQVVVDGYTDFIFRDLDGRIYSDSRMNAALRRIQKRYNDEEREAAEKEGREPLLLPKLHLHCLRHTFCTRFCENETNVKVIQSIMGHASIETTMDIYAEVTEMTKKEALDNLSANLNIF